MACLEVKNLMQQYRYGTTGIQDLSFRVEDGSFAVLGGEESGKTSLLRVLAGKEPPFRGEVRYDGKLLSEVPIDRRHIVYVRERGGIFNWRSVYYNLAYPLNLRKTDPGATRDSVLSALRAVGLEHAQKRRAGALSKPDRAKLKLARCFLREIDFYFVDDVLKNLSDEDRTDLNNNVFPKIRALPGVKIFATDNYRDATSFSDRGAVLFYGITEQVGDFAEIYSNPTTPETLRLTHGAIFAEEGVLHAACGEIVTGNKKIVLDPKKLRTDRDRNVIVATAADGYVKIYRAEDEKLIYFD